MRPMSRTIKSALFFGLLLFAIPHDSSASVPSKRILILFPYESNMPGFVSFDAAFRSTLTDSKDYEFEFYVECMDLTRFPDELYHDKLMDLYREKYSGLKIDLIVADLRASLEFLAEYGPESFHNIPIIYYEQDPKLLVDPMPLPVAAVLAGELDMAGTLTLAMRLHPDVRRVFVVTGASRYDQSLEGMARKVFRGFENQVDLQYLSGLPIEELLHRVSTLPEHSLVFYISIFRDGTGRSFKSPDALALISGQANAPIYSVSETYIGSGIVGGSLLSHSAQGARTGRVALRILAGEKSDNMNSLGESGSQYIFDARQLKRWGIREGNLPQGSDVRYRDFSIWDTYRWQAVGIASILIIQTLLVSNFIISLRKRRRAERALRKAADEWRTTFDSIPDLIMVLDNELRIVQVNAATVPFLGFPMDRILGKRYYEAMYAAGAHLDDCPLSRMLETKRHEDAVLYDEKRDAWLFVSADPVLDDKKEITGVVYTVKNVTEYKRAQEAIKASEEFNRAVLASLKNYVAILDKNGTILAVNEAWEKFAHQQSGVTSLAGLGPGVNYLEECRRSIQSPGDFAAQILDGIQSVLDGKGDTFSLEYPCDSPLESRWLLMKAVPFRNPGGGVVISITDISGRKAAELEAQLRREELAHITRIVTVGELATSLAHEINQPLTAILCNAEAAQRFLSSGTPDLDEIQRILDDIIQDDRRAGEVIRRMRALVKKETPRRETVDLNDTVRESIALVRSASSLEGFSFTTELDSELSTVEGDRVQLQQVILNLMLNATAAMRETPPALRKLVIRTAGQGSRAVMVSIRDTGTGIHKKDMDRLFEPFYTTKADGLGMGLSISRTIVSAHGGTIGAENNPEGGATFYFTLPVDRGEQP